MAGVLSRFSFATAVVILERIESPQPPQLKNCSNNENIVKSTAFWLSVRKKLCLEKGIAKEIFEPTQLNTLLEPSNTEIKNKHG